MSEVAKRSYPFYLTYNSGITKDLMTIITTEATTRNTFFEIAKNIGTYRTKEYLYKRAMYESSCIEYNRTRKDNYFINAIEKFPVFSQFNDHNGYNETAQINIQYIIDFFKSK